MPAQREAVTLLQQQGVSQRRACALASLNRATVQYQPRSHKDAGLAERLQQIAHKHPRWGVRKAYWIVRREGQAVNHKRVQRLWKAGGLQVRPRKQAVYRAVRTQTLLVVATHPGAVWSLDFLVDHTETGGKLRLLTVGDDFTRECLAIDVATAFPAARVQRVLARLLACHGAPTYLRSDNGPEFIESTLAAWLVAHSVQAAHTMPGHPWQNGVRESFHSRLRDELLAGNVFTGVADAQAQVDAWRVVYNEERPHQALGGLTPHTYKHQWPSTPSPTEGD